MNQKTYTDLGQVFDIITPGAYAGGAIHDRDITVVGRCGVALCTFIGNVGRDYALSGSSLPPARKPLEYRVVYVDKEGLITDVD